MQRKMIASFIGGLLLCPILAFGQDKPMEIPKKELPKKEKCVICDQGGAGHGMEAVKAGVRYKGVAYYFCNEGEVKTFSENPEAYIALPLPRPMPTFTFKTLEGKEAVNRDYAGKLLLVDFWATYCKPCIETMPQLQKLHETYATKGLTVLGVAVDEKGKVAPFLKKRNFTYTMLLDSGTKTYWKAFGVKAIPALFLVNPKGEIVKHWTGKPNKKEVEAAIQALLPKP